MILIFFVMNHLEFFFNLDLILFVQECECTLQLASPYNIQIFSFNAFVFCICCRVSTGLGSFHLTIKNKRIVFLILCVLLMLMIACWLRKKLQPYGDLALIWPVIKKLISFVVDEKFIQDPCLLWHDIGYFIPIICIGKLRLKYKIFFFF